MTVFRYSLPPLALAVMAACAAEIDLDAEQAALLQADQEWAAAASAGADIDRIVSYWADDATIYPANAPAVKGKDAIRQFVTESMEIPGFSISWQPTEVVVGPSGELGYTTGENAFTVPDADGNLITTRGRYVTIWRKEADGSWKCVVDIWNAGAPEQPPAEQ